MRAALIASVLLCSLCAFFVGQSYAANYNVIAQRLSLQPVINSEKNQSAFTFNYNAAYINLKPNGEEDALLVRCQNASSMHPLKVGPSKLALTRATAKNDMTWDKIVNASVVFESKEPWENYGTEDPRVAYDPKTRQYYMMYSAVQQFPNGSLVCRLSLATATNPADANSWVRHGPIFRDNANGWQWTKSGAIMVRESGPNYLIFGDSSYLPGIQLARSFDLLKYELIPGIYIHVRSDHFDSHLVESGPPPQLLSDGNYFFLYNSAKKDAQSGNGLQYNIGWAIIDGKDPTKVLARSATPILSPQLPWEIGTAPYLGQVPNVVFVEGMKPTQNKDEFTFFYGAADSVIGVASVKVSIHQ